VGDFLLVIIELFSLRAFVLSQFTRLIDRQTDGQMLIGKTALHTMQRGEKGVSSINAAVYRSRINIFELLLFLQLLELF